MTKDHIKLNLVESIAAILNGTVSHDDTIDEEYNTEISLAESIRLIIEAKDKKDTLPEENVEEQPPVKETKEKEPPMEEEPPQEENVQEPPAQEPPMEGGEMPDDGMGGEGMEGGEMPDDGMGGEGMEGEISLEDVGKMYELKQIHYRLIAVRNHLEIFVEEEFDEVKNSLTKAIDLFEVVIDNYDKYKHKIDEIIVMYYKFIQDVYELTKKKYRKYTNKNKKLNK